jgi:hypothetical protein
MGVEGSNMIGLSKEVDGHLLPYANGGDGDGGGSGGGGAVSVIWAMLVVEVLMVFNM